MRNVWWVLPEKDSSTLSRDSWVTQPLVVPGLLSRGLASIYLSGNFASGWMGGFCQLQQRPAFLPVSKK